MPDAYLYAVFLAAGALLAGFALRATLRPLMWLYVPASVVGGLVALAAMQAVLRVGPGELVYDGGRASFAGEPGVLQAAFAEAHNALRRWPGFLIAVVFAGLLLERSGKTFRDAASGAARQGVVAWIIILGEVTVGLAAVLLILRPLGWLPAGVPGSFGQLIEAGFAGGHGTAAAMGRVFDEQLAFPEGRDLGFFFATWGLVWGTFSGIVLVNLGVRRGWLRRRDAAAVTVPHVSGLEERRAPTPAAFARVGAAVIDPFVFQVLVVTAAVAVGWALQQLYGLAAVAVLGADDPDVDGQLIDFAANVPLFLFTLLGGWLVRETAHLIGVGDLIDPESVRRIVGFAIEFLIVAALATLQLEALAAYWLPAAVLIVLGSGWVVFCLLVVGRWLLPRAYWFELGLINYGMSTATTAQGMLLLRIVDRDLESGAAEDYAAAAPLTAPFIGGGILTVAGIPLAIQGLGLAATVGLCAAGMAVLVALGALLRRTTTPDRRGFEPG